MAKATDDPNLLTRSQFAEAQGWSKSYITALGHQHRLVLTDDGKHVRVAETLQLIAETTGAPERASAPVVSTELQQLQAAEKRLDIQRKQREEATQLGQLIAAADVAAAIGQVCGVIRGRLENLPADLAPQLAACAGDEARTKALLHRQVDGLLAELHRGLERLSSSQAPLPKGAITHEKVNP